MACPSSSPEPAYSEAQHDLTRNFSRINVDKVGLVVASIILWQSVKQILVIDPDNHLSITAASHHGNPSPLVDLWGHW